MLAQGPQAPSSTIEDFSVYGSRRSMAYYPSTVWYLPSCPPVSQLKNTPPVGQHWRRDKNTKNTRDGSTVACWRC